MSRIATAGGGAALRARRYDVVILGGALPGWIAAVRLGRSGARVLVVEEEAQTALHPGWREPFLLCGVRGGILDSCLRELGLPPMERRQFVPDPVAFQMILPEARIDIGDLGRSVAELAAWGLCDPQTAGETLRMLTQASAAERSAMLEAPVVRTGRLRGLAGRTRRERGLPEAARALPEALRPLLEAQARALSGLGGAPHPPEATARLLGAPFEGGVVTPTAGHGLRAMLRARAHKHHCEVRSVARGFELVEVGGSPGIAVDRSGEVWVGRALVLNAPRSALAAALEAWGAPVPEIVARARSHYRRVSIHLRARTRVVPDAMAHRLVCVGDPKAGDAAGHVATVQRFPDGGGSASDLLAHCITPDEPAAVRAAEEAMEAAVRRLMPFSEGHVGRVEVSVPVWDDDAWVADPDPGRGWPSDADIRLASRPPIYVLPREELAALGSEGELLLGWRAGDAIAGQIG